jgi:hypothetical protein
VSIERDQLELKPASPHGDDPHRVPRRPPSLGRASRIEDLETMLV